MDAVLALVPEEERIEVLGDDGAVALLHGGDEPAAQGPGHRGRRRRDARGYALKLLQSEGELTIASTGQRPATGRLVTQEYRVEGPVMIFLTTTAIEFGRGASESLHRADGRRGAGADASDSSAAAGAQTLEGLLAARRSEDVW